MPEPDDFEARWREVANANPGYAIYPERVPGYRRVRAAEDPERRVAQQWGTFATGGPVAVGWDFASGGSTWADGPCEPPVSLDETHIWTGALPPAGAEVTVTLDNSEGHIEPTPERVSFVPEVEVPADLPRGFYRASRDLDPEEAERLKAQLSAGLSLVVVFPPRRRWWDPRTWWQR